MSFSTILTGLETRAAAVFPSKSVLKHVIDVDLNKKEGMTNHYGIRPLGKTEIPGTTKFVTTEQSFEFIVSQSFKSVVRGDSAIIDKISTMFVEIDQYYKDLQETKAGAPSVVINITSLSVDEPEVDIEENKVLLRAQFTVVYRNQFS